MTVSQVAKRLGVCAATIYKMCATGTLQHVRVLNSIRVPDERLQAFISNRAADKAGLVHACTPQESE